MCSYGRYSPLTPPSMLGWGVYPPYPESLIIKHTTIMENKNPQKYDVKRIFASAYASKNNANVEDITVRVHDQKGLKKVQVEVGFGDETGWQLVQRYWATNLPTPEDLAMLKGKRIDDALLQTGWNDDEKHWGKIKVAKLVLEGGVELTFNGVRDEPGLTVDDDE